MPLLLPLEPCPVHTLAVTDVLSDKDILIWRDGFGGIDVRQGDTRLETLEEFNRRVSELGFQP